ncbi:GATA transcription factor 19-like [Henckelia pumila]|uniref:GATA transcription factor 19-like n=1 Tax=Henckelia pumila TaxID=405737 RepID=UPI003C6E0CB4
MMHSCCMVGGCTCGMYHTTTRGSSFSMLFSKNSEAYLEFDDQGEMYSFAANSPPNSSVDCTLSLGTPSTRLSIINDQKIKPPSAGFGWNNNFPMSPPPSAVKSHRGGSNIFNGHSAGRDPLLARRCANCDTTSTPLWRNGPRGPKSLCNACGIRFKKEERRATAAASFANDPQTVMMNESPVPPQRTLYYPSNSYTNEFRFAERFNVADRPSLVHNFTS